MRGHTGPSASGVQRFSLGVRHQGARLAGDQGTGQQADRTGPYSQKPFSWRPTWASWRATGPRSAHGEPRAATAVSDSRPGAAPPGRRRRGRAITQVSGSRSGGANRPAVQACAAAEFAV
ncbi:hypothetical protein GCM10020229_51510 [Kitasatospora albolonga]